MRTVVKVIAADGRFAQLGLAIEAAGLLDMLGGAGPFTVFAPTDEAFARLPSGWLHDAPQVGLLVRRHVLAGKVSADDLAKLGGKTVAVLHGEALRISTKGGITINDDVHVAKHGIAATNGLVHVVDGVLLPPQ
jgi:uncharacterized surface protein with fasciclin (FAS1) repeats